MTMLRESSVVVLVIGAGPSGATAALSLARMGLTVRVIDKRGERLLEGHGDGLNARTREVFELLGVGRRIDHVCWDIISQSQWHRDAHGALVRSMRRPVPLQEYCKHPNAAISQWQVVDALLSAAEAEHGTVVSQATLPTGLQVHPLLVCDPLAHAVTVTVQHLKPDEVDPFLSRVHGRDASGQLPEESSFHNMLRYPATADLVAKCDGRVETEERIHAKYVIATDGAHSWIRKALHIALHGDAADYVWGVLDIRAVTNFPDARAMSMINTTEGSILWIPREGGLTRIYTQLEDVPRFDDGRPDLSRVTPHVILRRIQSILAPYTIDYSYCAWWTGYQIGQRLAERYVDPSGRIFLAGDAVHTHSPKEGLGMNTSMQDTFNLTWKIAGVLNCTHLPRVLATYEVERRAIAQTLVNLDRRVTQALAAGGFEVRRVYEAMLGFIMGTSLQYKPNMLVAHADKTQDPSSLGPGLDDDLQDILRQLSEGAETDEDLEMRHEQRNVARTVFARNLVLGARLKDLDLREQSSGKVKGISSAIRLDGKWHVLIFPGDVSRVRVLAKLNAFGEQLKASLLVKYPRAIALVTIHAAPMYDVELDDFHDALFPFDQRLGYDYEKIYADPGGVYNDLGIDKNVGVVAAIRPDGYIGWVGEFGDAPGVCDFFAGFLIPLEGVGSPGATGHQ